MARTWFAGEPDPSRQTVVGEGCGCDRMGGVMVRTGCPLDCPDGCSLAVDVEGGRIVSIDAAAATTPGGDVDPTVNPLTQGFICAKVRKAAARVHSPERITTPLIRTGPKGAGEFRTSSWDEALDLVAGRILAAVDAHGAESLVPYCYNSSSGEVGAGLLAPLLWKHLGATHLRKTICAAAAGAAWQLTFGEMPGTDLREVAEADLVVVWGGNPTATSVHFPPLVNDARRRGAALVVVDPRRTPIAARADLHLALRPGTDVVAALAVAARLDRLGAVNRIELATTATGVDEYLEAAAEWTLERAADVCGVPVADLDRLASLLAEQPSAFFRLGYGFERNGNGGAAHRAVLALPVLAGVLGRPGSGVHLHSGQEPRWDHAALEAAVLADQVPAVRRRDAGARRLSMIDLGRLLTAPGSDTPVRLLFVQGSNPATTNPDQARVLAGLARDDLFCVVHDQVVTDTARYADVVLPATTAFEVDDVMVPYGTFSIERWDAAIPRVGESRTNDEVAAGLAVRLGLDPDRWDPSPRRLLGLLGDTSVLGSTGLGADGGTRPFLDVRPETADGRARLVANLGGIERVPRYRPLDADARYPLALLSPASARTINSIFGDTDPPAAEVALAPCDAADRGIADGDPVRVFDSGAELVLPARVDATLRSGVAVIPKGLWARSFGGELTANAFAPAAGDSLAGNATFNDARVQAEPAPPDQPSATSAPLP